MGALLRHPIRRWIPAVFVLVVVALSLVLPRTFVFHNPKNINFGYGNPPPVQYHPLTPARILDTRNGTGGFSSPVGPGATIDVIVSGVGGVPASGVTAAVINVTVVNTTANSHLTVFPTGVARPLASNLNWVAGQTVPNLVQIGLGTAGKVSVFNFQGSTDVVFDVQGFVQTPTGTPTTDGLFNPLVPARVMDTRNGTGGVPVSPVGPGSTLSLKVAGSDSVPATGVEAVVVNVTAANPTARSFVTVWPNGAAQPLASNLNFGPGQTIPNRVIVKVGTGGQINFFNQFGSVDLIVDVSGWFTDGTDLGQTGTVFNGLTPSRILDTRNGTGGFSSPVGPGGRIAVQVTGLGGVPTTGVSAVVMNVTITNPTDSSHLTVWPDGTPQPLASDLNYVAGITRPNLVVVQVGSNGKVDAFNFQGSTDVIFDVVGWYG